MSIVSSVDSLTIKANEVNIRHDGKTPVYRLATHSQTIFVTTRVTKQQREKHVLISLNPHTNRYRPYSQNLPDTIPLAYSTACEPHHHSQPAHARWIPECAGRHLEIRH